MTIKETLQSLAAVRANPCVTVSLNTHRTYPDNAVDPILLKDLLKEAEQRLLSQYKKREIEPLLKKMKEVCAGIDENYNLNSLHIFLTNDIKEIVRIAWPTYENKVQTGDRFDLRPLIKAANRTEEYMILLLSQGGVNLYQAMNDAVTDEIKESDTPTDVIQGEVTGEGFPFAETPWFAANMEERSNAPHMDKLVKEYFNRIDKALIHVYNKNHLPCIVVSTGDNYSRLMEVADRPEIYIGHVPVNYNHTETHYIVKQTWPIIKGLQEKQRTEAIHEMKEAVGQQLVLTDLQEIYQASVDGRGDLLIIYDTFSQPVIMRDERTIERADDPDRPGVISDITGIIAWNVLSMNGRVFFTDDDSINELSEIVLKTRY
ncbi:MAG: hypothetical protein LUH15_13290 [Tannerellaceae bacterium]|nr:hypothetical protein [Tannerellaceae bacterium]